MKKKTKKCFFSLWFSFARLLGLWRDSLGDVCALVGIGPPACAATLDRCVSVKKKQKKKNNLFFFFLSSRNSLFFSTHTPCTQPSRKSFKTKRLLGAARKSNKPLPPWIRQRTGNTVR
jgi:hypothetical protein